MNEEDVLKHLRTYYEREKRIEFLRYELKNLPMITENEAIERVTYSHGDGTGRNVGTVADKTFHAAANYKDQVARINLEIFNAVTKELHDLVECQDRLEDYVGFLRERQAEIIKLIYFKKMKSKDVAIKLGLSERTIDRDKKKAVEELVKMYQCCERFKV